MRGSWHGAAMTDEVAAKGGKGKAGGNKIGAYLTPHPQQAVPLPLKGKVNRIFYILRNIALLRPA